MFTFLFVLIVALAGARLAGLVPAVPPSSEPLQAFGFLVLLLINIILSVASYFISKALAPRQKGPRDQEFQGPTATAGQPVPVWWGTAMVAPNTVWWGKVGKQKHKQWFFSMFAHHLLGWGVVNEILDISFSDKSCRNWHLTGGGHEVLGGATGTPPTPSDAGGFIDDGRGPSAPSFPGGPTLMQVFGNNGARNGDSSHAMFGGDEQAGGIGADYENPTQLEHGWLAMYWGYDDATRQPLDPILADASIYGADCSRWPNFAYLVMGAGGGTPFYIAAQDGSPKPMKLLLRRTAWWDPTGDSPLGQTATEATIGLDANPAEILYDILTHKGYGIGRDPATLDLASFEACAVTLRDEAFGISCTLTRPTDAGSVIRDILNTIDATLATNPVTGQLRLKLIRPDYDIMDLPVLNTSNTSAVKYAPSTWKETLNEIRLTYRRLINTTEKRGFVDDVVTDQDLANYQATGRIRTLPIDLPYITNPDLAALVAARLRRAHSIPLARYSWKMNREGFAFMQGDAVVANESAFGVADLVLRITSINYGTLEDGEITVDGVQDVFSVTKATYSVPASGWTEPGSTSDDDSGSGSTPADAGDVLWGQGFY